MMMRKKKMMMMMRKRKRKGSCVMQREATHVQSMCQAGAKNAPLDITHSKHVVVQPSVVGDAIRGRA